MRSYTTLGSFTTTLSPSSSLSLSPLPLWPRRCSPRPDPCASLSSVILSHHYPLEAQSRRLPLPLADHQIHPALHTPFCWTIGSLHPQHQPQHHSPPAMPPREFPRKVAVFTDRFIFTTLLPSDVESHRRVPFCHPVSKLPCRLFSCMSHPPTTSPLQLANAQWTRS